MNMHAGGDPALHQLRGYYMVDIVHAASKYVDHNNHMHCEIAWD